jgi:hypothetical protein
MSPTSGSNNLPSGRTTDPQIVVRMVVKLDIQGIPCLHDIFAIVTRGSQWSEWDERDRTLLAAHPITSTVSTSTSQRYCSNLPTCRIVSALLQLDDSDPVLGDTTGGVSGVNDDCGKLNDSSI